MRIATIHLAMLALVCGLFLAKSTPVQAQASQKLDALALGKIIDQEIQRQLKLEKINASPLADDAEFLRRVYLDLIGVIPSSDKVNAFLKNSDPLKRARIIDELLADARFGSHQAEIWQELTIPHDTNNKKLDVAPFQHWLTKSFNDNMPLNKLAHEIITASGEQAENGAVTYYMANPTADKVTDNVTRLFLGVQLQCAQCHNHPFTSYKQNEYWGMAAFFMKVKSNATGVSETALAGKKGKKNKLPESAKIVPAKFLQAEEPKLAAGESARSVLARWMTSPDNPFFARAMVNRFWYEMFGRGLVSPVDDMHADNTPSHPELLATMTDQLKANGFDLKYLLKAICNSEAYQRTSKISAGNGADSALYSHRLVRVMSAEQLYDSIAVATGKTEKVKEAVGGKKKKAVNLTGRSNFVNFFRISDGADPLEYQIGIPQALRLMNSSQLNAPGELVASALSGSKTPAEIIEKLHVRILSRRPTTEEVERYLSYVVKAVNPRVGYGDVAWVLLNSSEFATNH